jgi:hypothetical protein
MSAIKLAQALNKFAKLNSLSLSKANLKHDLIHAICGLGITLQDEVTVFFLQRGQVPSEDKAMKVAAQLASFNRIPNTFNYSLLEEKYLTYKVEISEELVEQVATILNIK